ncbi:hypothetical protein PMAYCL1PPCAC_32087, partial [Pristionchus mayeri]
EYRFQSSHYSLLFACSRAPDSSLLALALGAFVFLPILSIGMPHSIHFAACNTGSSTAPNGQFTQALRSSFTTRVTTRREDREIDLGVIIAPFKNEY